MSLYLGENLISGTQIVTDKSERIGQIITSTIQLTDAGLHLLDGSLISGGGSYDAFVDYIADLVADYPDLFCTEANWQTAVTTYGVCGKFVYDSVNNTVRLPKITGILEGTTDVTALGDLVEAGLPNINATGYFGGDDYALATIGGVFSNGTSTAASHHFESTTGNGKTVDFNLNLSQYNSIYGNSSTVQPQTIKILYYIVIATSTKTDIEVDIDEIATDLNGKADIDGSNITTNFSTSLVNNMSDTANIYMSRMSMPSSTYDTLTLGASGTTYTAPANGWFFISKVAGASGKYIRLGYSPTVISVQSHSSGSGDWLEIYLPVKKGDVVKITYSATGTTNNFRFVYAQGSESEAS